AQPAQGERELGEAPGSGEREEQAHRDHEQRTLPAQARARCPSEFESLERLAPVGELPFQLRALGRDLECEALLAPRQLLGAQPHRKCWMSVASSCRVAASALPFAFARLRNTSHRPTASAIRATAIRPVASSR